MCSCLKLSSLEEVLSDNEHSINHQGHLLASYLLPLGAPCPHCCHTILQVALPHMRGIKLLKKQQGKTLKLLLLEDQPIICDEEEQHMHVWTHGSEFTPCSSDNL
jgi:hypothetical protein